MASQVVRFTGLSDRERKKVSLPKLAKGDRVELRLRRRDGRDEALALPPAAVSAVQALLIVAVVLATRSAWRLAPRAVPAVALVGVLDMTGNAAYLAAVQVGQLAVASVLSSLYPVTTVILAAVVLHERITREHAVGIALAVFAIVLIGLGSA